VKRLPDEQLYRRVWSFSADKQPDRSRLRLIDLMDDAWWQSWISDDHVSHTGCLLSRFACHSPA
jgi:hypothetical protein